MTTNEQPATTPALRWVAFASAIGTTIEYYDFTLYASAAALLFNKLFFPTSAPMIGTLAAFATFFVGYLSRPLGGLIFGHFGDRLGRKGMLIITILMMGLGTFFIGLLPTYHSIGIAAPLLLLVIRIVQGIGLGGEYGGGILMTIEHAPKKHRGYWGSIVQVGTPAGVLIPVALLAGLSTMPETQFESWGWRIPFLLSIGLILLGLYVRLRLTETPEFQALRREQKHEQKHQKAPLLNLLRSQPRDILLSIGAKIAESGLYNIYYAIGLTYAVTELDMPKTPILITILVANGLECFTLPFFGRLSDRIGRRRVYVGGALFQLVLAFPFFWLLNTRDTMLIGLAMALAFAIGHGCMYGPQAALFSKLYPVNVRYSGLSLTQQFGATLGGGLSPLIGSALLAALGGAPWLVAAVYMIGVSLFSGLCALPLSKGEEDYKEVPIGYRENKNTLNSSA
jgi:MFS family permease